MTPTTTPATLPEVVTPVRERVTPILPSEAIRLGCLIAPVQSFGDWATRAGEACAAAAMNLGWGRVFDDAAWMNSEDSQSIGNNVGCPEGCGVNWGTGILPHLNDYHRWSRERIASWLESQGL